MARQNIISGFVYQRVAKVAFRPIMALEKNKDHFLVCTHEIPI